MASYLCNLAFWGMCINSADNTLFNWCGSHCNPFNDQDATTQQLCVDNANEIALSNPPLCAEDFTNNYCSSNGADRFCGRAQSGVKCNDGVATTCDDGSSVGATCDQT